MPSQTSSDLRSFLDGINDTFGGKIWTKNEMDYVAHNLPRFKFAESLKLAVSNPIERFLRQRNVEEYYYRFKGDSVIADISNENGGYRSYIKMSAKDAIDSPLRDDVFIHFDGNLTSLKDSNKNRRRERLHIVSDARSHKPDAKSDRTIVELLDESDDYLVADAIYEEADATGSVSGDGIQVYSVMASRGIFADKMLVEITFRPDKTRKVRII